MSAFGLIIITHVLFNSKLDKITEFLSKSANSFNLLPKKNNPKTPFLTKIPLFFTKIFIKSLTKSRFTGNYMFGKALQTWNTEQFTRKVRFLPKFGGEGG